MFFAVEPLPQGLMMALTLAVQFASKAKHVPGRAQVRRWALAAHGDSGDAEVTIRYVDEKEGRALNLAYRQKEYATNVLTFVHDLAPSTQAATHWSPSAPKRGRGTPLSKPILHSKPPHPGSLPQGKRTYAADIVICAPVIWREAREQKKPVATHHAHMVMHGVLHAQGFDHELEAEAAVMEVTEIALLRRFRIKNPYEIE